MKQLILASGSPARKEILEKTGIHFRVEVSQFEEDMTIDAPPAELAIRLSRGKAREVASRFRGSVVLAADSFGVFQGELLGKPHTIENAKRMLMMLSGNKHSFITGFTIIDTDTERMVSDSAETAVYFRQLTTEEIEHYIEKEQPLEKAGGYELQGLGGVLVERIEGDYYNIMGLPIGPVAQTLKSFGIAVL